MHSDSRAKMVASAATLIATRGVSATSFTDVLAESGAPRGSIYHHFPDGKIELAADAVRWTAERVAAHQRGFAGTTARGVLERFIDMWRRVVVTSGGATGCVIAGVTVDSPQSDALIAVARAGFESWIGLLATQLAATGLPEVRARTIATMTVAGMEGALILCRVEGGVGPLETVAAELLALLPAEA